MSKRGFIKGSALDSVAAAHEGFNTINGQPSGNKGGVDFASGIHSQKESAKNTAQGNAGAAEQGFGTINGDPLGLKGGNGFAGGLRSTRDTAQNAGSDVVSELFNPRSPADATSL
ncbi:hypothetical protein, partial [Acinetobacter baumannii]|uniref:hypothetical protein n=1 Tax=Acinetobacter baumannii TaxID=470 RepID=UPI00300D2D51